MTTHSGLCQHLKRGICGAGPAGWCTSTTIRMILTLEAARICVIGCELQAVHGRVLTNFLSLWMLLNVIPSRLGFQLNSEVISNLCLANIDLLELSVTPMPFQNNVLCISTIPRGTEGETMAVLTSYSSLVLYNHVCLRAAVCFAFTIVYCGYDNWK